MTIIKNKKFMYFASAYIALILVFAILFTNYGSVLGEVKAYGSTYISELQVFEGNSTSDAAKKCEKAGYTPVKKNINRSSEGDDDDNGIYIVGYKTTDNKDEGITGISLLQMNSGYQDYTYGDVAERAVEKLGNIPDELSYAIDEFKENYSKKSPAAVAAVNVLNCYFVEELNNQKLGDYLVSGDCTVDFVKKLLSRSSTSVVSAFCNALGSGVADYGDDNWAKRISQSTVIEELKDEDNNKRLDIQYKALAVELTDSLQSFASSFNEAKQRYEENNDKLAEVETEADSSTEIDEQTVEDMTTGGEIKTEDGDAGFLLAYNILNQYDYDSTTKLGDYIVSLGNSTYDETANLRKIYPLVDSLTDGQVASMRLNGVAFTATALVNDEGLVEEANKQIEEIKKEIKKSTGNDSVSIWIGTDQTVYNQKVAVTKEAYRANSAGQIYNTLTSPDAVDDFLSEAMSKLEVIMAVVTIGYCVTSLATTAICYYGAFAIWGEAVSLSVWATCCAFIGSGALGTIFGVLGCAFVILNYVALIALVVILVAFLVKYLWDLFTDDDSETFTAIPSVMFDVSQNRYVRYDVVNQDGNPANINGENARRWNALYTTKSSYVGDPICSSNVDDLITVQYDDNSTPQGYKPVKCFGEVSAANLNANSKSDSTSIYMFCKNTTNEINEGTDDVDEGNATYLSKLSLSVEETETAAKAALTKSGYKVLDTNLTPVAASDKKYTYLGYTTTTNPDDAITDIRISARNTSDAYIYGNASYTSCGTTITGDALYYTSYESAGTPILADILIKNTLDDIPDGYEPINMFCGGNAFNFNVGSEVSNIVDSEHSSQIYDNWNDKGMYLYFKPSVSYTEGEEYISGIMLVAGEPSGKFGNSADDYIEALHLKKLSKLSLTQGSVVKYYMKGDELMNLYSTTRVETYICYTTTHNPYRAIYGIKSYTSAPGNASVPAFLGSVSNGSYAACDVMFELPKNLTVGSSISKSDYLRGIYDTHSYQFALTAGSTTGLLTYSTTLAKLSPEDYETVDWKTSAYRGKGIYVLGPVTGGTPLTIDDVQVSEDSTIPEGFLSIQDFKTPNRTEVHNLGYNTTNSEYIQSGVNLTPVYIYQKTEQKVQKKYISSISVSTYSLSNVAGDNLSSYDWSTKNALNESGPDYCVQNLMSSCTDEIIETNLGVEWSKSFQGKTSGYAPNTVSYIGVSRTDSEAKAITGIIKYITDDTKASPTIQVGGVSYTKAGDMIYDANGSYYLYYTTSSGANPGMPITSISVSADVFEDDCATAMATNSVDVSQIKEGAEVKREASKATLYGDTDCYNYIHMGYADTATMMGAIYVGHGKTKKEAQANLLSLGCNICVDMDINRNTGGEYVYIGYSRYTLLASEIKKGVAKYAVRDIVLTVGKPHQSTITIDGVKYKSAIDEYTSAKDSDSTKAVSLNTGTGGKQIYLYYTTTKTKDTAYPIAKLGLACKDYGMINDDSNQWEHVFDIDGNRVNLNEGALYTIDDGKHIADNRMYLYASRTDNAVKEGAAVDMNSLNKEFVAYDVYMKGA